MMGTLTPVQTGRLEELEAKIESGLTSFIEVGKALTEIHDSKLYAESDGTFEEYCQRRWSFKRRYAERLIEAHKVVANLDDAANWPHTNGGPVPLPKTEAVAREVAKVPAKKQAKVWKKAVETAPTQNGKPHVTAAHVREVAAQCKPKPETPHRAGAIRNNPAHYSAVHKEIGRCVRAIEQLNKQHQAEKFYKQARAALETLLQTVKQWQQALR